MKITLADIRELKAFCVKYQEFEWAAKLREWEIELKKEKANKPKRARKSTSTPKQNDNRD